MAINWGLMPDTGNALASIGQAIDGGRKLKRETRGRNALARVLGGGMGGGVPGAQPNDGAAYPGSTPGIAAPRGTETGGMSGGDFADIANWNPEIALNIQKQQKAEQQQARMRQLLPLAQQGDAGALQVVLGIDFPTWKALDDRTKDHYVEVNKYIGQAGLAISRLPPAERAAAWDSYAQQGAQMGFPELSKQIGHYSEEALHGVIAHAGLTEKFLEINDPKYIPVPNDNTLVNVRSPEAVRQFGQGAAPAQPQTKTVGGKTYYMIDGQWHDSMPGGGSGNATGGFHG